MQERNSYDLLLQMEDTDEKRRWRFWGNPMMDIVPIQRRLKKLAKEYGGTGGTNAIKAYKIVRSHLNQVTGEIHNRVVEFGTVDHGEITKGDSNGKKAVV